MSQEYTLIRGPETTTWRERKTAVDAKAARPAVQPRRVRAAKQPSLLQTLAEACSSALLRTFEHRS